MVNSGTKCPSSPNPKNRYSIRVIYHKSTDPWQTEKFEGKKLIQTASGLTFDQVMPNIRGSGTG
jgi:hypothetical protein